MEDIKDIPGTEENTPKPGTKEALKVENAALEAQNAAMAEEIEKLKAELEAKNEPKVTESEGQEAVKSADDRVDLFVEKGYANDEPYVIISINGVNYQLPRGKISKVPKFVADEYYRSRKAQQALDVRVEQMLEEASK